MKNIGIFISSFDPIHSGHIDFANLAVKSEKLDKVYFIVEPRPKKQGVKSTTHRVHMVMLAVARLRSFGTIILKPTTVSLSEPLAVIKKRFSGQKLFFILPAHGISNLSRWHLHSTGEEPINLMIGTTKKDFSDIELYLKIFQRTKGLKFNFTFFESADLANQSRLVKREIRAGKQPKLVTKPVYSYIKQHGLYASPERA